MGGISPGLTVALDHSHMVQCSHLDITIFFDLSLEIQQQKGIITVALTDVSHYEPVPVSLWKIPLLRHAVLDSCT